jgi:hypothetical protein
MSHHTISLSSVSTLSNQPVHVHISCQDTIAIGTTMMDIVQMFGEDGIAGTHLMNPRVQQAWAGLWADAGPAFYIEHLKRLRANGIQPYFMLGHVHQLEIVVPALAIQHVQHGSM